MSRQTGNISVFGTQSKDEGTVESSAENSGGGVFSPHSLLKQLNSFPTETSQQSPIKEQNYDGDMDTSYINTDSFAITNLTPMEDIYKKHQSQYAQPSGTVSVNGGVEVVKTPRKFMEMLQDKGYNLDIHTTPVRRQQTTSLSEKYIAPIAVTVDTEDTWCDGDIDVDEQQVSDNVSEDADDISVVEDDTPSQKQTHSNVSVVSMTNPKWKKMQKGIVKKVVTSPSVKTTISITQYLQQTVNNSNHSNNINIPLKRRGSTVSNGDSNMNHHESNNNSNSNTTQHDSMMKSMRRKSWVLSNTSIDDTKNKAYLKPTQGTRPKSAGVLNLTNHNVANHNVTNHNSSNSNSNSHNNNKVHSANSNKTNNSRKVDSNANNDHNNNTNDDMSNGSIVSSSNSSSSIHNSNQDNSIPSESLEIPKSPTKDVETSIPVLLTTPHYENNDTYNIKISECSSEQDDISSIHTSILDNSSMTSKTHTVCLSDPMIHNTSHDNNQKKDNNDKKNAPTTTTTTTSTFFTPILDVYTSNNNSNNNNNNNSIPSCIPSTMSSDTPSGNYNVNITHAKSNEIILEAKEDRSSDNNHNHKYVTSDNKNVTSDNHNNATSDNTNHNKHTVISIPPPPPITTYISHVNSNYVNNMLQAVHLSTTSTHKHITKPTLPPNAATESSHPVRRRRSIVSHVKEPKVDKTSTKKIINTNMSNTNIIDNTPKGSICMPLPKSAVPTAVPRNIEPPCSTIITRNTLHINNYTPPTMELPLPPPPSLQLPPNPPACPPAKPLVQNTPSIKKKALPAESITLVHDVLAVTNTCIQT